MCSNSQIALSVKGMEERKTTLTNGLSSVHDGASSSAVPTSSENEGIENVDRDAADIDGAQRSKNPILLCMDFVSTHRAVEIALLSTVIVLVWCVLCLPIVFYHVSDSSSSSSEEEAEPTPVQLACDNYLEGRCYSYLLEYQHCYGINSENIMVSPRPNAEEDLRNLEILLNSPQAQASQECKDAALSFTCLYLYPLCGDNELYQPSAEQCRQLSKNVCALPWQFAATVGVGDQLPNCDDFLSETKECVDASSSGSGLTPEGSTISNNETTSNLDVVSVNLTCRSGFSVVDGFCMARCDSWEQSPHGQIVAVRVVVILAACIVLITGSAVFIFSVIQRKRLLVFPTVFLVYMSIGCCVIAFFVIVNYMDQDELFCSKVTVEDAIDDSTPFCVISGIVWQYCLLNITLCWMFHIASIFWKVVFPLKARQYQRYQQYFHMALGVASLLLPVPSVIAAFATDGYSIIRFPPLLCGVRDQDAHYYSLWFLLNLILGVGITLLIITLWKVHKHQGLFRAKFTNASYTLSPAEKKLFFIFIYYIVFALVTLVYYSLTTRDTDKFVDAVEEYFICESVGYNSDDPCPQDYEQYRYPIMEGVVYILMAFIPTVSLVFIIHIQRTRKGITRLSGRLQSKLAVSRNSRKGDHPDSAFALESVGRDSPLLFKMSSLGPLQAVSETKLEGKDTVSQSNAYDCSTQSPLSE